jgi:hypothetical protein
MERSRYNVYFDNLLSAERSNPLLSDKLGELDGLMKIKKLLLLPIFCIFLNSRSGGGIHGIPQQQPKY